MVPLYYGNKGPRDMAKGAPFKEIRAPLYLHAADPFVPAFERASAIHRASVRFRNSLDQ